jgi:hypothetical protein
VHDLFLLTEKAAYVAKTAAAACRKRAADKEPVSNHRVLPACTVWLLKVYRRMISAGCGSSVSVSKGSSVYLSSAASNAPSWTWHSAEMVQ